MRERILILIIVALCMIMALVPGFMAIAGAKAVCEAKHSIDYCVSQGL